MNRRSKQSPRATLVFQGLETLEDRLTPSAGFSTRALYESPATALNLGSLTRDVDRDLKLDGKADWIRFQIRDTGGGNDYIFVTANRGGSLLELRLFNAKNEPLGVAGGRSVDYTAIKLTNLPAGVYFASVTGKNGATGIKYSLHVDAPVVIPKQDDNLGANNTKATPKGLGFVGKSGIRVDAKLPRGDEDWFTFRLAKTAGPESRVLVTAPLGWKVNWNVEVFDHQGKVVGISSGTSPTHGVSLEGKLAGTYLVHVFSDGGHGLGNYRLGVKATVAKPAQARTLSLSSTPLPNPAINQVVQGLMADGQLSRQDWIGAGGIFDTVEADGTVSSSEFSSLQLIIANAAVLDGPLTTNGSGSFSMYNYVYNLAGKVINGNFANATFQGQPLGNLTANSSANLLDDLVDKWFLGLDRPDAGDHPYVQASENPLFGPDGPSLDDFNQGDVGDCYFLSSIGTILSKEVETAPNYIAVYNPQTGQYPNGLFIDNADGTYTVKFYYQSQVTGEWIADYVTVDNFFPTGGSGSSTEWYYANAYLPFDDTSIPLWVALLEKAYIQENASAVWSPSSDSAAVLNAYKTINGLYYANQSLMQLTGQSGYLNVTNLSNLTYQQIVNAYLNGVGVVFGTSSNPSTDVNTGSISNDAPLVTSHAYMMYGYNATNQTILLRNPWGSPYTGTYNSVSPPSSTGKTFLLIEATVSFLQANFDGYYAINPNITAS